MGVSSLTWNRPTRTVPFLLSRSAITASFADEAMPDEKPHQSVTFRGRGYAWLVRGRVLLYVCPICSQRNARAMVPNGRCAWCAYVPDPNDIDPAQSSAGVSLGSPAASRMAAAPDLPRPAAKTLRAS